MRLSERIEQLEERIGDALGAIEEYRNRDEVAPGKLLEVAETMSGDLDWLRELRQRRIAMGRDPDDERNAAADLERQMVESLTPPPDHEALARQVLAAGFEVAQRVAVMLLAELEGDGAVNTYVVLGSEP